MMVIALIGSLSWTFVGPEGGDILSVASDGEGRVLAAGFSIAYVSTDSGLSWSRIDMPPYGPVPGFLRGYKVAILGGRMFLFHSQGFIYSDDGSTWSSVGLPNVRFVSDASGGSLSFISQNGVYLVRTPSLTPTLVFQPGGDTSLIAVASFDSLWYAFARTNPETVIVYRGVENAVELKGTFPYGEDIIDVAINPYNPDEILLSVFGGILTSTDGGASFNQDFGSLLSGLAVPTDIDFVDADSVIVGSFYFSGGYVGYRGLYGWSYSQVYGDAVVRDIDGPFLAAFGRGVVYTPDGSTFEERNDGLYAHTLFSPGMVSNTRSDRLAFINLGGLPFYTEDGGATWNNYGYKMDVGQAIEVAPYAPEVIYISGYKGSGSITSPRMVALVRSSDGGSTFTPLRDTTINAFGAIPVEIQVGSDPANLFLVNPGWSMEYSSDSGNTISQVFTSSEYYGFCFSCVDTLFMVVEGGVLYASYDAGATWDSLTTIPHLGDVYLTYREGNVYYTTGDNPYVKVYNLATDILDSIDLSPIFSSVDQVEFSLNGHVFLTGYSGSIYKVAYGSTFDNLTVEDAPSDRGGVLPFNSYVFFYSLGDGGFYASPYPVSVAEGRSKLHLVYTRSGIRILGFDGPVELYSVKGTLIKVIGSGFIPYGSLPSGVYLLRAGDRVQRVILR